MITAKVIADSVSGEGNRLTTLVLTYPRFIHAEFMTHRVFSRNASSSRAIPLKKVRAAIANNPATPVYWGSNQPGMQAGKELQGIRKWAAQKVFMGSRYLMLGVAWTLDKLGLHKQLTNRLLEPWSHITVIVTATEWENFFNLRLDPAAQPEMRRLAWAITMARNTSTPKKLLLGQWHLPFVADWERTMYGNEVCVKFSVARCARVSYLLHDGEEPPPEKDIELHDRLLAQGHMSPFEHQARPSLLGEPAHRSNLNGWTQYRKLIHGEAVFRKRQSRS